MILTADLILGIDDRLNRLASNKHQQIFLENKIVALNEAQLLLIKQKIGLNNIYKAGLDSFAKRYDDLQEIIVMDSQLSMSKADNIKYSANLSDLDRYMFHIKSYITADKDTCKDRALDVNIIPHSDVQEWLANKYLEPSFEYQETFAVLTNNKIEVYTDKIFVPTAVYTSYIRYPDRIQYPGCILDDGSDSVLVNCELSEYLMSELLDIAVERLAQFTDNPLAAQAAKERITNNE